MRIDEFHRAAAVYRRWSLAACIVPMGTAIVCGFAIMAFHDDWQGLLSARVGPVAAELLSIVPMAAVLFLGFGSMIALSRRVDRTSGIPCPHCGKGLAHHPSIVVASRNCPHCGRRVIED